MDIRKRPACVTITGIDARTDLDHVQWLSDRHPVEWAVLVATESQGIENRFPEQSVIERLRPMPLRKAMHLCRDHAKAVVAGEDPGVDLRGFNRVQVNHRKPVAATIVAYAERHGVQAIMQTRDLTFPDAPGVQILFDRSGGFGRLPDAWPRHPGFGKVGYAGGISPDTLDDILASIDTSGTYWLDMETGVRTDDWLDLGKCERVLKKIYGTSMF